MIDYNEQVQKTKCVICGFIFFTHYTDRLNLKICSTCDPENKNTQIVKKWEK